MGEDQSKKASLWREGVRSFNDHWREWLFLGLLFFFILAAIHGVSFYYIEPVQDRLRELKAQNDTSAAKAYLLSMAPSLGGFIAIMLSVVYVEHYLFFSFFMKKELSAETAKPSFAHFFCFLAVNIQVWFTVMIPGMAGILLSVFAMKLSRGLFIGGVIVSLLLMVFLGVRLYPAIPLAAARIRAPLKASWALTRGNCWRLIGNAFMIFLVFLGLSLLIILASVVFGFALGIIILVAGKAHSAEIQSATRVLVRSIVGGGMGVYMAGVICAYGAAVCRILYHEKKAADSNFILTTRG